ncbi:MAG: HIT family protein [Asgard group archaeon]
MSLLENCTCKLGELIKDDEFRGRIIEGYEPHGDKPWVFVPQDPGTFGHLVVVSGKCYKDISDWQLMKDKKQLGKIMAVISTLASKMKLLNYNGKKCEKIYVLSQCEYRDFHLHFHLYPRFKGDNIGNVFLIEKELEEARWIINDKNEDEKKKKEDKIGNGRKRIEQVRNILNHNEELIQKDEWARSNEEREKFILKIKKKIEELILY